MSRITAIEISHHRLPLDPAFKASWDGRPRTYFDATIGYAGMPRKGTDMLCVNPLTGAVGNGADAAANQGALVPHADMKGADLTPGLIPAGCTPQGLLLIGPPPKGYGTYVLPGNNYHVFDYALFWANLRADAEARLKAFGG